MHRRPTQASAVGGGSGSNNGSFGSLSNSGKRKAPPRHGRSDGPHGIEGPNRTSAAHNDYDDDELGDDDDRPIHEPTPAVVRRAPASLPGPLRAVLQFAIFDTLLEDDDFLTVIRKVLLTVAALFGVFMPGYGAVFLALHGTTAANITFALAAAVFFEFVPLFAYVRVTRRVPERAMLATMAAALVALALGAASAPHVPFGTFIGLWAMTMAIIDAPLIAAWYAAAAPALGLAAYNEAVLERSESTLEPGWITGVSLPAISVRLVMHFASAFIVVCIGMVVKAINMESQLRVRKSKSSAVLADLMSVHLSHYRIERARGLLAVFASDAADDDDPHEKSAISNGRPDGDAWSEADFRPTQDVADEVREADPHLVASLLQLTEQLHEFRPHLPNWMLEGLLADSDDEPSFDSDEEETEMEDSGLGLNSDDVTRVESVALDSGGEASPGGRPPRAPGLQRGSSIRPSMRHTSSASPTGALKRLDSDASRRMPPRLASAVATVLASRASMSSSSGSRSRGSMSLSASATFAVMSMAEVLEKQTVGRAKIYFEARPNTSPSDTITSLHRLVDSAYKHANDTHGAIHATVGDVVDVSWNAARSTAQPAAKAARFLARMRASVAASSKPTAAAAGSPRTRPPLGSVRRNTGAQGASASPRGGGAAGPEPLENLMRVSGAASAGESHVLMAGSNRTKSLAVSGGAWHSTLEVLSAFAKGHDSVFVIDEAVANAAVDLRKQPVAALRHVPSRIQFATHHRQNTSTDRPSGEAAPPGALDIDSPRSVNHPDSGDTAFTLNESVGSPLVVHHNHKHGGGGGGGPLSPPKTVLTSAAPAGSVNGSVTGDSGGAVQVRAWEVLGELQAPDADGDNEWMYVLAKGESSSEAAVKQAFNSCMEGDFDAAVTVLEKLLEDGPTSGGEAQRPSRLVAHLLHRARALRNTGSSNAAFPFNVVA